MTYGRPILPDEQQHYLSTKNVTRFVFTQTGAVHRSGDGRILAHLVGPHDVLLPLLYLIRVMICVFVYGTFLYMFSDGRHC